MNTVQIQTEFGRVIDWSGKSKQGNLQPWYHLILLWSSITVFSTSPLPHVGRKDSGTGDCSYSVICFFLTAQDMSLVFICCMLLKPFSVYRIINFLIDSFQPSLQLIQPLAIFSPYPLAEMFHLIYSFPSSPPQIILPAPLNTSRRLELLTPGAVK